tara:strand:- start:1509 stop:2405 length:897 start_codon:yes stop_codon:yes gene_type:complete
MPNEPKNEKTTIALLQHKKSSGTKISMLTAYDYTTAQLLEEAGIDIVFVGDSLGTNVLGYHSPHQVTMNDILHHVRAVRRGVTNSFLLADMPFLSYQCSTEKAVQNAGILVQDGGVEGVKLEGGEPILPQVKAIAKAGIPVMGHIGYNPQYQVRNAHVYNIKRGTIPKIQGKGPKGAKSLLEIGQRLQDAGAFALVIELVTVEVASLMAEELTIPVIGIGSGVGCDGQVLVFNDLVGLSNFELSLLTPYAKTRKKWIDAINLYRENVESEQFPTDKHSAHMEPDKMASLKSVLKNENK